MKKIFLGICVLAGFQACNKATEDTSEVATDSESLVPTLTLAWETDTISLITPESVLLSPDSQFFYVSCIGAVPPNQKDNDGYIAKVSLSGEIMTVKWANGMSAPKGMGIFENTLYVTDIDRILMIDTQTGMTTKVVEVPGAGFLNDIDVASDGTVYFTDSDFHKAYSLKDGKITELFENKDLERVNGVFVDNDQLVFSSSNSGNVVTYNLATKSATVVADSIMGGDGVEKISNGYFVSSWNGELFYLDNAWKKTLLLDTKTQNLNAADIEVVNSKKIVVVPTFFGNKLMAYTWK